MPRDSKPVSLYPPSVEDVLAALVRIPPPPKTVKPARAKRLGHEAIEEEAGEELGCRQSAEQPGLGATPRARTHRKVDISSESP